MYKVIEEFTELIWQGYDLGTFMLGTAQLGFAYGIANSVQNISSDAAEEILMTAWNGGVRSFDTAQSYGVSESVLGESLERIGIGENALIVTKLEIGDFENEQVCLTAIKRSLSNLRVGRVFGVLSHFSNLFDIPQEKYTKLFSKLRDEGLTSFTGVSVYTGDDALKALESPGLDIVQMPLNVFDRTAVDMGVIDKAKQSGKLLVFRSTFLQGLLTMEPDSLPSHMSFACDAIRQWRFFCAEREVDPVTAAIQIALELACGFPLLIGAEASEQVRKNTSIAQYQHPLRKEMTESSRDLYLNASAKLRNPANWGK